MEKKCITAVDKSKRKKVFSPWYSKHCHQCLGTETKVGKHLLKKDEQEDRGLLFLSALGL